MEYKMMMITFGMVFLAELGDKTQLATFCLSADCTSKTSVFIGAAAALVLSSFLAVIGGALVSRLLPTDYIKLGAGAFFILVGVWTLYTAYRGIGAI